jgi:signal transduction histidine kinase/DNA-binding response OmpR family regulator
MKAPLPLRILAVDDNPDDRVAAKRLLLRSFPTLVFTEVGDVTSWNLALRQRKYDVALIDYRLGWTDGMELLRELRGKWSHVPIIMFSGTAEEAAALEALREGVDEYLPKTQAGYEQLARTVRFAIERAKQREALRDGEERFRFLAEAGAILSSSLDYQSTLEHLAQLALPRMGQWCEVHLVQSDGELKQVAAASIEVGRTSMRPSKDARASLSSDASFGHAKALRTGMPDVIIRSDAPKPAPEGSSDEYLDQLATHSVLSVPLQAMAKTFGALSFGTSSEVGPEERRVYGLRDVELAMELAHRAEVAIENAQLFAAARVERVRAEQANRMKDEFLATVSHELRTPLTAMLGWVLMLRTGKLAPDKRDRALETIERNARTQAQLIEDLLDVSRIITGKLHLEIAPVSLHSTVAAAIETVRPAAQAKSIALEVNVPADLVLNGDATRLQQVVWNLISNGVKFTPAGGSIHVSAERSATAVTLTVSDTGQGIEPDMLANVFERFWQAEGGSQRRSGGLGLGLAIVRHLVELHGGTVAASSQGPGKGASFTVKLPLVAAVAAPRSPLPMRPALVPSGMLPSPPALVGLSVLVVDDEEDNRTFLKALLEGCHARICTASSAEEGMHALREFKPRVLISDVGMPRTDGHAFIRQIRKLPPEQGGQIPALALTAYARSEDRESALNAGFDAHLAKPVEPATLLELIASLSQGERA